MCESTLSILNVNLKNYIYSTYLLQIEACLLGVNHLTSFAELSLSDGELLAETAKYFLAT